jgi:hypothetical protein
MAKSCKSKSHWNDGTSAIIDQSGIPRPLWVDAVDKVGGVTGLAPLALLPTSAPGV